MPTTPVKLVHSLMQLGAIRLVRAGGRSALGCARQHQQRGLAHERMLRRQQVRDGHAVAQRLQGQDLGPVPAVAGGQDVHRSMPAVHDAVSVCTGDVSPDPQDDLCVSRGHSSTRRGLRELGADRGDVHVADLGVALSIADALEREPAGSHPVLAATHRVPRRSRTNARTEGSSDCSHWTICSFRAMRTVARASSNRASAVARASSRCRSCSSLECLWHSGSVRDRSVAT